MSRKHGTTPTPAATLATLPTPTAGPGSALGQVAATQRAEARAAAEAAALAKIAARFARQDAAEARKASTQARKAEAAAPVPESFRDAGSRTMELVRVLESTGIAYLDALARAEAAAIDAAPKLAHGVWRARTVSDKTGRQSYRFFVRLLWDDESLPRWSGVKVKPAAE